VCDEHDLHLTMLPGYSPAVHKPSAVPLYRRLGKVLDFVGTGTLIQYHGQHLLISCAHCFDNGGEHNLLVGGNEAFPIDRPVLATRLQLGVGRKDDPVDFAVVALRPSEAANLAERASFIPEGAIEGHVDEDWPDDFDVCGFPCRDNAADMANRTLEANAVVIPAKKAPMFGDRRIQKNSAWYLPLTFEPKKLKKMTLPNFVIPPPDGQGLRMKIHDSNCRNYCTKWATAPSRCRCLEKLQHLRLHLPL
jgi:hypothetical protein